jgi:homoserine dehydrogenase
MEWLRMLAPRGARVARAIAVTGRIELTAADVDAARALGGAIRPVAFAEWPENGHEVHTFSGPAWLPFSEPLAALDETRTGIRLDIRRGRERSARGRRPRIAAAPRTRWLLRLAFPGIVPAEPVVRDLASNAGLAVERIEGSTFSATTRWLLTSMHARGEIEAALARLAHAHRLATAAFRSL